jgi:hypothetical protein
MERHLYIGEIAQKENSLLLMELTYKGSKCYLIKV